MGFCIKGKAAFFIILLCILFGPATAYSRDAGKNYTDGVKYAKAGNNEMAFISFHSVITYSDNSKYAEDSLFATGEYYFMAKAYDEALQTFERVKEKYPDSKTAPLALAYLLKIAEIQGRQYLADRLKEKIISMKQHSFLFSESKEYKYTSAFLKNYKVVHYIDKIEFYIDEKIFAQVSH